MKSMNALWLIALSVVVVGCGTDLDFDKSDLEGNWKTDCMNQSSLNSMAPGQTFSANGNTSRRENYQFDEHQVIRSIELYTSGTLCENLAGRIEIRGTYDILENTNSTNPDIEQKQKTIQVYVSSVTATAVNNRAEELKNQLADCSGINWVNGQSSDASFKFCAGQQLPGNYGSGTSIMLEMATMSQGDLLTLQSFSNGYAYVPNQTGVNTGFNNPGIGGNYRMFFRE